MLFNKQKNICILSVVALCMMFTNVYPSIPEEMRQKGFVYLHEVDPTIQVSLRYYTDENFTGRQVQGYKKPVVIMTAQAAQALKTVQQEVQKDGYCLVVYDGLSSPKSG